MDRHLIKTSLAVSVLLLGMVAATPTSASGDDADFDLDIEWMGIFTGSGLVTSVGADYADYTIALARDGKRIWGKSGRYWSPGPDGGEIPFSYAVPPGVRIAGTWTATASVYQPGHWTCGNFESVCFWTDPGTEVGASTITVPPQTATVSLRRIGLSLRCPVKQTRYMRLALTLQKRTAKGSWQKVNNGDDCWVERVAIPRAKVTTRYRVLASSADLATGKTVSNIVTVQP